MRNIFTKTVLIVSVLFAASTASAVTAVWTGRQAPVQTVTYRMAWKCEYMFAGQKFWEIFEGNCPNSIDVQ